MKRSMVIGALLLATGCAAVVTPHGTYLEPLPFAVTIAPSVVAVEAPPYPEQLRPLPEVYLYPNRYIYSLRGTLLPLLERGVVLRTRATRPVV